MTDSEDSVAVPREPLTASLYLHVPFCLSKCSYCDFYSLPAATGAQRAHFVDAALFELGHWSHYDLLDDVVTAYIGGGTPTVLGEELVRLVRGLGETARLRPDAEFTVETNPETTDARLVARLIDAGVNRFSLGVQSFDDDVLHTLGRCHTAAKAADAARVLEDAGVPFSIDLICGVSGQSFGSWDDTLERAVACGARHVSVYPLTIEEGTPLAEAAAAGRVPRPDPDAAADMMIAAELALAAAGMPRYEVANYAQPGFESRHNLGYWSGRPYVGIGPHAASMLSYAEWERITAGEGWPAAADSHEGTRPARVRYSHDVPVASYVRSPLDRPELVEYLSAAEAAREDLMLGMRLTCGVMASDVEAAGLGSVFVDLEESGLVTRDRRCQGEDRWRTTQRGWLLGNRVFEAVWTGA